MKHFIFVGIFCLGIQLALSQTFNQQCLMAHNKYRAQHNAAKLSLNAAITKWAQQWANRLARTGKFEHRKPNRYGENLYAKFGGSAPTCAEAVKAWYDEIKDYNFNNPGFSSKTGHFTQVVWKGSKALGCAKARNGTSVYVVCNYNPPGNVIGSFPANVQRKTNSG